MTIQWKNEGGTFTAKTIDGEWFVEWNGDEHWEVWLGGRFLGEAETHEKAMAKASDIAMDGTDHE